MSEMLERILSDENIKTAYKRVYANKGAGGVDGVTVQELEEYMQKNWNCIKEQIRKRTYKPQPVKRVEIPKPNGGVRKLGIPTVYNGKLLRQQRFFMPIRYREMTDEDYAVISRAFKIQRKSNGIK